MSCHFHVHWVYVILVLAVMEGIHGVDYTVTNNARGRGGKLFDDKIGADCAERIMRKATTFAQISVFKQFSASERKQVKEINLFIDPHMEDDSRYESNGEVHEIHLSARFMRRDDLDVDLKTAVTALIHYEITHILQWTNEAQIPPEKNVIAVKDGIAGFAVLEAHYKPKKWVESGEGDRWDESPEVTAQFLLYCNSRKDGFVSYLNKEMQHHSIDKLFHDYLDENINDLWKHYKATHGGEE